MIQRCNNPDSTGYENYGGRGISVDPHWLHYPNFYADMGPRPEGKSLERIDNDGNYTITNCRWATAREQIKNRRCNPKVEINGETLHISEWCDRYGMPTSVVRYRMREEGWDLIKALTTPIRITNRVAPKPPPKKRNWTSAKKLKAAWDQIVAAENESIEARSNSESTPW